MVKMKFKNSTEADSEETSNLKTATVDHSATTLAAAVAMAISKQEDKILTDDIETKKNGVPPKRKHLKF